MFFKLHFAPTNKKREGMETLPYDVFQCKIVRGDAHIAPFLEEQKTLPYDIFDVKL